MVTLYVEGGGDGKALKTECRQAFASFITKAGIKNRPRIVASGSRRDAYESFCTAVKCGQSAVLLIDSEEAVSAVCHEENDPNQWRPWSHLKQRSGDDWDKPTNSSDTDCHLMVQVMESWFLTDRCTLKTYFGQHFMDSQLPALGRAVETVPKAEVYDALDKATKACRKGAYSKGGHSFAILGQIDPNLVIASSPWAKRFIGQLKKKMGD